MEFNYSNPEFYEADEGFPKLLAEWVGQGYLMEQNKMEPPGYWLLVLFYLWNLVSVKVLWVNLKNTYSNGWEIFLVILKCGLLQKLEMLYWTSKCCLNTETSANNESFNIENNLLVSLMHTILLK